jgi:hypothetical protein
MAHTGIGDAIIFVVPLLLIGEHLVGGAAARNGHSASRPAPVALRRAYLSLLVLALAIAGAIVGRIIVHTILVPPGWDYQALWLYGHVAVSGQNPYLPGPYHALGGPGPFVPDFAAEVLDVGAVYPPPTLLLFATIGWLPLRVAVIPWMIVQTAAFVGVVIGLWRIFLPQRGGEGLAFVAALALLLPATDATFGHGQVNFLAVLCVLGAWRARDKAVSGALLVGAAIVKLLYGALWLYPLLRRKWPPVLGIAAASVVACVASLAAFGIVPFLTYIRDNPVVHRMPSYYFSTFVNQSLLGAALRLHAGRLPTYGPPTGNALYLAASVVVAVVTAWGVIRQPRTADGEDVAFVLLILAGMLIYPWTLSNYYVLLLVPMCFLWSRRPMRPVGVVWTIVALSLVYPVTHIANGLYAIIAALLLWATVSVIALAAGRPAHAMTNPLLR